MNKTIDSSHSAARAIRCKFYCAALFLLFVTGIAPTAVAQTYNATYTVDGISATQATQTFRATGPDTSGVLVKNSGMLSLQVSTVTSSGNSSSDDNSSFYGQNAGVLATTGGQVTMSAGSIATTGRGATGAFAYGTGSTGSNTSLTLLSVPITCNGDRANGIEATNLGTIDVRGSTITTSGADAAAISVGRGGGKVVVAGGSFVANNSEGVVIDGAGSVNLSGASITAGTGLRNRGVLIYQSAVVDTSSNVGALTMIGGTFTWPSTSGPMFYVTNSTGIINLNGVIMIDSSPTLIKAAADAWGTTGSNGGNVQFTSTGQKLTGDMVADNISSITANLTGTSITGAINTANTAQFVALALNGGSTWTLTANSYLTTLTGLYVYGTGSAIMNIYGNGYNVYYDSTASVNSYLGGAIYDLENGGCLMPRSSPAGACKSTSASKTTLTYSPSFPSMGDSVKLVATVASGSNTVTVTPTGTLTFSIDGTAQGAQMLASGSASMTTVFSTWGPHTVNAAYNGGTPYSASSTSSSITVSSSFPTAQTITFPNPGTQTYGTVSLNATASSGLPITYTVTSGTAAVSGSKLTLTVVGLVTVQAAQSGNANYTAAVPVSVTFAVAAAPTYTLIASQTLVTGSSNVTLTLASTNYAGTVRFTTSVSSTNGTASNVSASAPSVTLTNGGTGSATLTIVANAKAANHSPVSPWKKGGTLVLCAVLMGAPFTVRRKRASAVLLTALVVSLAGFLIACGGGGGSKTSIPTPTARTYTVTVTPTGTGTVTNQAAVTILVTVP